MVVPDTLADLSQAENFGVMYNKAFEDFMNSRNEYVFDLFIEDVTNCINDVCYNSKDEFKELYRNQWRALVD